MFDDLDKSANVPTPVSSPAESSALEKSFFPSLRALVLARAALLPLTGLVGCADNPAPDAAPSTESTHQTLHGEEAKDKDQSGITIMHTGKLGYDFGDGIGIDSDGNLGISLF